MWRTSTIGGSAPGIIVAMTPAQRRALQRAGRNAQEAMKERNRLIRAAYADGASIRQIADAVGTIKRAAVHKIVRAKEPD